MISCDVIQDLLPLYADGQASNASKELIEDHTRQCDVCRAMLAAMCTPMEQQEYREEQNYIHALKMQKKKIRKRIIQACVLTVLLCVLGWWLYMEVHFTMETPALVTTSEEDILKEMPKLALTQPEKDFAQTFPQSLFFPDTAESEVCVLSQEDAEPIVSKLLPEHAILVEVAATHNTVYISYMLDAYSYTLGYMDPNHDGTVDAIEKAIGNGDFSGKGADTVYSLRYIPVLDSSQYEKHVLRHVWFGFLQMP